MQHPKLGLLGTLQPGVDGRAGLLLSKKGLNLTEEDTVVGKMVAVVPDTILSAPVPIACAVIRDH